MSKNSFTQNFNDCVNGFPIASVAAHMVLHEGIGKDLLKIGVPAAIIAGLYNYGDDISQYISDWGAEHKDTNIGGWNIGNTAKAVGDKLHSWHDTGTHWMQDSAPGKWFGLGGQEAMGRQAYEAALADSQKNITDQYNTSVADLAKQRDAGTISNEEYRQKVAEAGTTRDRLLSQAQVNAADTMRYTMQNTVVDKSTGKTADPNAYKPQMMNFSGGKMTNTPYQPGQQPPAPANQGTPPQGGQPQGQPQTPGKPLPDASKTAIAGVGAGAAGAAAFGQGQNTPQGMAAKMTPHLDALSKDMGVSPTIQQGSGMRLRTDNPEMLSGRQNLDFSGHSPFGPSQQSGQGQGQPAPAEPTAANAAQSAQPGAGEQARSGPIQTRGVSASSVPWGRGIDVADANGRTSYGLPPQEAYDRNPIKRTMVLGSGPLPNATSGQADQPQASAAPSAGASQAPVAGGKMVPNAQSEPAAKPAELKAGEAPKAAPASSLVAPPGGLYPNHGVQSHPLMKPNIPPQPASAPAGAVQSGVNAVNQGVNALQIQRPVTSFADTSRGATMRRPRK